MAPQRDPPPRAYEPILRQALENSKRSHRTKDLNAFQGPELNQGPVKGLTVSTLGGFLRPEAILEEEWPNSSSIRVRNYPKAGLC